jgi:hypothetical protein
MSRIVIVRWYVFYSEIWTTILTGMKFGLHMEEGEGQQSHVLRSQGKTTWWHQIFDKRTLALLHLEALGLFHHFTLYKLRACHPQGPLSHRLGPRVCFAYVSIRTWL